MRGCVRIRADRLTAALISSSCSDWVWESGGVAEPESLVREFSGWVPHPAFFWRVGFGHGGGTAASRQRHGAAPLPARYPPGMVWAGFPHRQLTTERFPITLK